MTVDKFMVLARFYKPSEHRQMNCYATSVAVKSVCLYPAIFLTAN